MRTRAWFMSLVLTGLTVACGDQPTEVAPEREGMPGGGSVAFATASAGGLSITTDKDDYAPGDTVWFTGAGWTPGDTLDIVLTDSVDVHNWAVGIDETGGFRDSTYVVDVGDIGVTFTLTATSRLNPEQSLTVIFTDGTLTFNAIANNPFSPNGDGIRDLASLTIRNAGPGALTGVTVSIRAGTALLGTNPTLVCTVTVGNLAQNTNQMVTWDGSNGSNCTGGSIQGDGQYTARVYSTTTTANQPESDNGNQKVTLTLDRTKPSLSSVAVDPTFSNGTGGPATLSAVASDLLTNITSASYTLDGGSPIGMDATDHAFDELSEAIDATLSSTTVRNLSAGSHNLCVSATDQAGNTSSQTCVTLLIDKTVPTVTIDPISNGTVNVPMTITGTATDPAPNASGIASVALAISGQATANLTVTNTGTNFSTWSASFTPTQTGNYTATATARDNANNSSTPAARNFSVASADNAPPTIDCTPLPDQAKWYGANVTVNCTAIDNGSGLANSSDASFPLSTTVSSGNETATAATASHQVCDKNNNCATAGPYTFKVDLKNPTYTCDPADGQWYASDVSLSCTGSDDGSGFGASGDRTFSFSLSTSVDANTEDDNAATGTQEIADQVGNKVTAGPITGNKIDKKAPSYSCGSADGQWHATNVDISCTASDGGSGVSPASDESFKLSTSVAAGYETDNASTNKKDVLDAVGNKTTAGPITGNKIDRKGPMVTLVCPVSVILNSTATGDWTASDDGSGLVGASSGKATLVTSPIGPNTGSVKKQDAVGNETTGSCNYNVIYDWNGFFQPVDNNNLNVAKAGSAIPVKFSLGGNQGMDIIAAGFPSSISVACGSINETPDAIEETVNAGNSSLTYDVTANQYVYVWKSEKSWAGTCRRLDVKLSDGTKHVAFFKWNK